MFDTKPLLVKIPFPPVRRDSLKTLQLNLGYRCNLSCMHCHVNAGPTRYESMERDILELVLQLVIKLNIETLDLTGGAPELNPHFRWLVGAATELGVSIIDRCNLTILNEPEQENLAEFLAYHGVTIVASLPCYQEQNVTKQRGKKVFGRSIKALLLLNSLGYGKDDNRILNLVYNPTGEYLPASQQELQAAYKRELKKNYGVIFNNLFSLANMPIKRYGGYLLATDKFTSYMQLLKGAHQENNLHTVMCRSLLSIDYRGFVYDCDFNQMLGLPLGASTRNVHLRDVLEAAEFEDPLIGRAVRVAGHCYGCTAGQGSSCGGALNS
jgi:radical SAM/Cys-rich protein